MTPWPASPGPVPAEAVADRPPLRLGEDPAANTGLLQHALDAGGSVSLAAGSWPLAAGVRLPAAATLRGAVADGHPATTLRLVESRAEPLLHVLASSVRLQDLVLDLPARQIGEHDGDAATAVTVGRYLYDAEAGWLQDVELSRLRVVRRATDGPLGSSANSIAVMGAVRDVRVEDVSVRGGGTGLAVHWGAVASSVREVVGPSYHPHRLRVDRLHVRDAFEGFYLSSVHDVAVRHGRFEDVEIGFRLLPGDNTGRYAPPDVRERISSSIEVTDCDISWHGPLYGVRAAGWGRSEVDGAVTRTAYRDTAVRRCAIRTQPRVAPVPSGGRGPRAVVVLEAAGGLLLEDLAVTGLEPGPDLDLVRTDGVGGTALDAPWLLPDPAR